MRWRPRGSPISLAFTLFVLVSLFSTAPSTAAAQTPNAGVSADDLVRAAVQHQLDTSNDPSIKHAFRSRKETAHGSQTKLYAETTESIVGLVIANNDQPIPPQQLQGEMAHLNQLAHNPDDLGRKHRQEREDADRSLRIVRALPDAFLYQYDGTEMGRDGVGKAGDELVRLKFRPNPKYVPPSRIEQMLPGMQGYLLIDKSANRLARIDGTLFRDVTFGWGILGHLDKGGNFLVDQGDCGDGTWEIRHMRLDFTGKIMMFKGVSIKSEEVLSNFRRIPGDTTFAQGVEMLKSEEARLRAERESTTSARRQSH
ncbi:MAG TPA: hypothetical protein VFO39_09550 [Candidatus Sulfotelmatobacter sp.]|nr:hypothetical protein [Candidatus Sulfotelmatobacter sp.]